MKKNNIFVTLGYILALVCFLTSLMFRLTIQRELVTIFMGIGGCLLFITSISKLVIDKKNVTKSFDQTK